MTRIIVVRHGHVDWLAPERFRGRAELPLSELGHRLRLAAAGYIAATWQPEAVYTSPLGRCRETAAAIAAPVSRQRPSGLVKTASGFQVAAT